MAKPQAAVKAKVKTVKKVKKVIGKARLKRRGVGSLSHAFKISIKEQSGRADIKNKFKGTAPKFAKDPMFATPITQRAGYPVVRAKGSVDPGTWKTIKGKPVTIDFERAPWLPDDWAQGVKTTEPIARSMPGRGGTYTVYMSPSGRTFYHQRQGESSVEAYLGRQLGPKDGFRGQLRRAWLAGEQIKLPADTDAKFFRLLSAAERKALPGKEELHYAIVSARRAACIEGMKSIASVQSAFRNAGVEPTWYVDAASLEDYRQLGLKAVVGGPLTHARNMALNDAAKAKKACVQCSDDISSWEYRDGAQAASRDMDAVNAAHDAATRYIVSPVAAARFILAKMRGVTVGEAPRLGGVYMISSCSRVFGNDPICRHGFVIGDFFVADKSTVRFDETMKLKEDYDFCAAHMKKHGSLMRLNRMTVSAKHYTNSGGAVENRDAKGKEEQRNINILKTKWPGVFIDNVKRPNEVLMKWGGRRHQDEDKTIAMKFGGKAVDEDDDHTGVEEETSGIRGQTVKQKSPAKGVRKNAKVRTAMAKRRAAPGAPPLTALIVSTGTLSKAPYIALRCKKASGMTVGRALSSMKVRDANGCVHPYTISDLRYDMARGYLTTKKTRT